MALELKIIESGMLHKVCSEESEAQAVQRCALECGKAGMTPCVLLSKQAGLSGVHRHQRGCDFLWGSVAFV